jgi:hypothetical protein
MQALVRHIMGWRAARQAADAEGPPPVLYLDCRAKDMSTPVELAKHLRELVTKNKAIEDAVNKLLGVLKGTASMGGVTFSATLKDMFDERRDVTPMASVIASYTELLELFKARRYKPIIVIDEANVLQAWREADAGAPELDKLLRFFVKITKQDNAAHVVLATSSSFLESWLRKSMWEAAATRPCLLRLDGGGVVQLAHTLLIGAGCRGTGQQAVGDRCGGRPARGRGAAVLLRRGRLAGADHGVRRRAAWWARGLAQGA